MQPSEIYLLIIGMAVVTYIPRVLPAFLTDKIAFKGRAKKFLSLLPYAAMSALVFPGVFSVDDAFPLYGIAGGAVAALLAYFKCPLIVSVLGAVGVNYLLYLLF